MYQELRVFSGNAHPELAKDVCGYLETPLGQCEVFKFSNENIFVRFCENIRARDVFLVQPIVSPVNDRLMELFVMIDAAKRASAGRITAVVPYYAYGRSDKKDQPRVPITARLVANFLETAGADRLLTVDLHAGQIQGFFNIPVDELTALYIISRYFKEKNIANLTVVATDVGDAKRARNVAGRLDAPLAIVEKRRLGNDQRAEVVNIIGEVKSKNVLIVDDEVDTGSTMVATMEILRQHGAVDIYVCCTHPVLSGPAIQRIEQAPIKEMVVTDSIPLPVEKRLPNITVLSLAPLLGEAIRRIHTGHSVGELFQ
ncbi:MAG: ribose-phosphate pyrophosphokinase [Dehalococcoidia bacterium SM23_28_2]|nr:MAG: ribose-phosphate pyrophosphokinase [Dehalococcoidia bacterium SM23_28_2]